MLKVKVSPDGGEPFEVDVLSRDIIVWEKAGKDRSFSDFLERMRMTDIYALAHAAAKRLGVFGDSLEDMESRCDVELVGEVEGTTDPTLPAA